jgi:hypothetical protein
MISSFFKAFASTLAMTVFAFAVTTAPARADGIVWYPFWDPSRGVVLYPYIAGGVVCHQGELFGHHARCSVALTWRGGGGAPSYNRYGGYDYFCNCMR